MKLGICTGFQKEGEKLTIPHLAFLKSCGFEYVELPLNGVAALTEGEFLSLLACLKEGEMPCLACNCLMDPAVKMVGPAYSRERFLLYARGAVARARRLGAEKLVLGSGGSRNIPAGYPREKAREEFAQCVEALIELCQEAGITLILEHLNLGESNLITSFQESGELAREKASPAFRTILDCYHFALGREPLSLISQYREEIGHIHFARLLGRTYPQPADFPELEPILTAIRESGYDGTFSMECSFPQMEEEPAEYGAVLTQFRDFFAPGKIGEAGYLRKYKKYNCAQSVVCAYRRELGLSEEAAFRISEALGGGVSGLGSVCGAVSGMAMVAGALSSTGEPGGKADTYREVRALVEKFQEETGSILCREIKNAGGDSPLKTCNDCIFDCIRLLEARFGG